MTISSTAIFSQAATDAATSDGIFKKWEGDATANGYDGDDIQQNKPWYFYIQHDSRYEITLWDQNGGVISPVGTVTRKKTEDLISFHGDGANTHELEWMPIKDPARPSLNPAYTWFDELVIRSFSLAGRKITVDLDSCPTCLTVTYNFEAMQYKYTPPTTDLADSSDVWPVAIRFALEQIT